MVRRASVRSKERSKFTKNLCDYSSNHCWYCILVRFSIKRANGTRKKIWARHAARSRKWRSVISITASNCSFHSNVRMAHEKNSTNLARKLSSIARRSKPSATLIRLCHKGAPFCHYWRRLTCWAVGRYTSRDWRGGFTYQAPSNSAGHCLPSKYVGASLFVRPQAATSDVLHLFSKQSQTASDPS